MYPTTYKKLYLCWGGGVGEGEYIGVNGMKGTVFDGSEFNLPQFRFYLPGVLPEVEAFPQCLLNQLILKVRLDVTWR